MQYEPGMKLSEFFTKERFSFFYSERELEGLVSHKAYLNSNSNLLCSEESENQCYENIETLTLKNSENGCYEFGWLDAEC